MKKLLYLSVASVVFGTSNAFAILEEEVHQVPDSGSTLLLLGLAMVSIVAVQRFVRMARA